MDELKRKVLALLVAELGQAKVWSAHVSDGKTDGRAATFEEANAQFAASCEAFKAVGQS